jgi:penicillin-binding protein 2
LILPELAGGNQLVMEYNIPARGDIYDREGLPIVTQSDAFAFGIQTDQIDYDMISALTGSSDVYAGWIRFLFKIRSMLTAPAGTCPCAKALARSPALAFHQPGRTWWSVNMTLRYYFRGGLAPQAVGYTQLISPEQLNEYRRKGYNGSERIGQTGVEKWAEDYLAGSMAAPCACQPQTGQIISTLGQSARNPQIQSI